MNLSEYVQDISKRFAGGDAREHTYRGSLQNLLETVIPNIQATNEPARIKCGSPDYVLTKKNLPVGYIEAKDIGVDLNRVEKDEQLKRYLESLDNLILTDYLEFRFFKNKEKVETLQIAEIDGNSIRPLYENFDKLKTLLVDFASFQGQTIKSAKKLAEMMANKAILMRDVFRITLEAEEDSTLKDQMRAFKSILMHDLDEAQFADIYAQTITYGLFTARLHDETPDSFTRGESLTLIPASNPFLRQLFTYVAGADLDTRVIWIVDALCEVYRATDLKAILKDFGSATGQNDPILHFYETFLGEYDRDLKKERGVWYTPEPVVQFIVQAIDDVLKSQFNLPEGLADVSKVNIEVETDRVERGKRVREKRTVHKVQLLDVATGTGTFLAEAVKNIYHKFKGQEGLWSRYVDQDLLPRLHGFELLMASYAMCHMKLDLLLQETGYRPLDSKKPPRVGVYLTNSLEEHHKDADTLFASWLSHEANAASRIKKDMPIMVAFGNPPYSGESSNKGDWIMKIMDDYKKEPSGGKLQERNAKWLNNDYVKFIRLGEYYIEKNGEGVLAYITDNSYLENTTFRGMRWHLLNTFDDIYILDLHGNSNKGDIAADGTPDKNVFDIKQGVAIIIAVKKAKNPKKGLANLHHASILGDRPKKFEFLKNNTIGTIPFRKIIPTQKHYFFVPKENPLQERYDKGFSVFEAFPVKSVGIATARDDLTIHFDRTGLEETIERFSSLPPEDARNEYQLGKDARDWQVKLAQHDLKTSGLSHDNIQKINYRPFDTRWTYFTGKSKGFHCMPRGEVMKHFLAGDNIGLSTTRSIEINRGFEHVFLTKNLMTHHMVSNKEVNYVFPLFVYESVLGNFEEKTPNIDQAIFRHFKKTVPTITPQEFFDYIYAVLHSPRYRKDYAEFLKSDFPKIPYPKDAEIFRSLLQIGSQLRLLHSLEHPSLNTFITNYPIDGDHTVLDVNYKEGSVWINENQYFGNVPAVAWDLFIGGYQPANRWLKDRKGRMLTIEDIRYYQRIIGALTLTSTLVQSIDDIEFL